LGSGAGPGWEHVGAVGLYGLPYLVAGLVGTWAVWRIRDV
jgi:hypothetical protein